MLAERHKECEKASVPIKWQVIENDKSINKIAPNYGIFVLVGT